MARPTLKWRLEGGYSRFLEGSKLEVQVSEGPFRGALDVFPLSLIKQHEPWDFSFRVRHPVVGEAGRSLRWRVTPQGDIRGLLLFAGNAFLGNFRVPSGCFAVQWDIEARADASVSAENGLPFLLGLKAGTRLYHSWVSIFSEDVSVASALKAAWQRYKNPFDPTEVQNLGDREVIRWRWEGHAQVETEFSWSTDPTWSIPGRLPLVKVKKEIGVVAGMSASLVAREEGQFSLQLRRQGERLSFHLVKDRSRKATSSVTWGVQLKKPVRIQQIGLSDPGVLHIISEGLSEPLVTDLNRICEEALARRLGITLALSRNQWKKEKSILDATWRQISPTDFGPGYCQLLEGRMPSPSPGLQAKCKFEFVTKKSFSIQFGLFDWLKLKSVRERERKTIVSIGPSGDIVIEESESFEKTTHNWDSIQFLKLVSREVSDREGLSQTDFWTWSVEEEVGEERLRSLLRMALQSGIIREFSMPARSSFPARIRLILGTLFSAQGLEEVKLAPASQKWKTLIRALELVDPDKYARHSFWRDWIDNPELRALVDREPVQSTLLTRYPVAGRTDAERVMVVNQYRTVRNFLDLLEHWKRNENEFVLRYFDLRMDLPVFVFFHLLCPPELRSSAALLSGDIEQSWGDVKLFEAVN
ncbi:MAG TPA: hypothetical protein PLP42_09990 [Acidobacteriota bacterium]|nr:hypothetical protein [Acidobacteriota bacterium]